MPKPPALPDDLSRAQQSERAQERGEGDAIGAYEAIVESCRHTPRKEPKDPCGTAALRRALALEQLGRFADAAAAFGEVRSLASDGRIIARALLRQASLYAGQLAQPAEALRLCREIIPRWPDEVAAEDALRLLVELETDAQDAGLLDELARYAEDLRTHDVIGSFALYYRARELEKHAQLDAALTAYDTIWQRFARGPLFDDSLMAAAQLLRGQKRSAEAALRLEKLQSSFTSSFIVGHYNKLLLDEGAILLGEVYLNDLAQPERAIAALAGFLKRQRSSLLCDDALLLMAESALRKHTPASDSDRGEACRYLNRLLHDYPSGNRVRRATALRTEIPCQTP